MTQTDPDPNAVPETDAPAGPPASDEPRRLLSPRRIAAILFFLVILWFALQRVLDPFGDAPYIEVSHGNHVHYVPRDRDPNVPIGNFPTVAPGPGERILPNGRVVPTTPDEN